MKKIGIIGIGQYTVKDYLPLIAKSSSVELVAACDIDKNRFNQLAHESKVKTYENYRDMLINETLDFVVIATPHDSHAEILQAVADHGIHAIVEKPLGLNLKKAIEIIEIYKKKKLHLFIPTKGKVNTSFRNFFDIKQKFAPPFYVEMKYTLNINRLDNGWRSERAHSGGGCIMDMGYHMIDLLLWYFGVPDQILADFSTNGRPKQTYDTEDTANIYFRYSNGLFGLIMLSRCSPLKTQYVKVLSSSELIEITNHNLVVINNEAETIQNDVVHNSIELDYIKLFSDIIDNNISVDDTFAPGYHLNHLAVIQACYLSKELGKYINPKSLLEAL